MPFKHTALFFCTSVLLLVSTPLLAKITKIDPLLRGTARFRDIPPKGEGGVAAKALSYDAHGFLTVDCFVRVYSPAEADDVAEDIVSLGGTVRSIIEDVMTAYLPVDIIEEVASWDAVRYIEAGKPMRSKLSTSIVTTNVDDVHAGTGLDARYDGSGVIVGIVDDTRLDYGHADFTDAAGKTRVLFLWDKGNTGSGVSEVSGSSGLECTKAEIDASTCNATSGGSSNSHSTHVAGIAAGDDSTFKGMAPGADIINVYNVETDADSGANLSTTIVDDVRYVFAKASALKQAAVVNLSLGTSIGAHDNTSSMETSLNNLVSGHPGRAITNAAGNETFNPNDSGAATYNGIHAAVSVASATDEAFDFAVRSGANVISNGREVIVDIWLAAGGTCTVELDGFDFAKTAATINMSAVSAGNSGTATDGAGTTLSVDFTDSTNANNGKQHAVAKVTFTSAVSAASMQDNFSFDVIFRGNCSGDAWLWPDANATVSFTKRFDGTDQGFGYTYQTGDSDRTTTIPATASKLIAVGSFMSRQSWTDVNGTTHNQTASSGSDFTSLGATGGTVNEISPFSSLGPTPDGRKKPDITAPGEPIVSSMSANEGVAAGRKVDAKHFKNEGTSMSAPHVAGIIALMFQKNPCLTSEEVLSVLQGSAATDSFTGTALPDNTWGYGKVDALEAMKDVTTVSGTCGITGSGGKQSTPVTTTSGSAPGGGCFHIAGGNARPGIWIFTLIFLLSILFFTIRCRISHGRRRSRP